jgi:hypothetical protein
MTPLQQHALARAMADARIWREMALAALDRIALAEQAHARHEKQIAALREELAERMNVREC